MGNTKILKTSLLLIFFFAFCFATYADNDELFVWTDENGQTHYSKTKPPEWKVDPTGPKWESAGTIEFPPLYEKKDKQMSNDNKGTNQIPNVVVSKHREVNLIERREQAATQNRIIAEQYQRFMDGLRLQEIESKQQDLEFKLNNKQDRY